MSQILVTGEAKIRDIQGPVVANSGVITALDGAASQYVRGDGTLADFPTSSGGGSSVSYYLNSSVSQGTIGGVAYRELSKEPIIGAGTDIAISSNGYVASYLTDANDPDVILIPGGNFNCEFYFSVNNNTGNPFFYAELYKYDGTTFTLLGSSVGVPEYITQGTTIAPYYFAIPVATATLALTDRLAIRIYVNVGGRTVTLHTENGHLCQVVTTLSKGMVSLNNLTDQSQFLTTGTSGTDFNIVSSGDTHTFNIPSASASNRGLVTIASQSFAGIKTFNDAIKGEVGVLLKNGVISSSNGYTALNAFENTLIITSLISGTPFSNNLEFAPSTSNTYTFPNASGTIALTSNLSSYVPYTGATSAVDLGSFGLTAVGVTANSFYARGVGSQGGYLYLKQGTTPYSTLTGASSISADGTKYIFFSDAGSSNGKIALFELGSLTNNTNRTYTLPDLSGTLALLEGTQTFSGAKTFDAAYFNGAEFNNTAYFNEGLWLVKNGVPIVYTALQTTIYSEATTNNVVFRDNASKAKLEFNNSTQTYTFPAASGTIALTSNLSAYVPYTGATANVNLGIYGLLAQAIVVGQTSTQGYIHFKTGGSTALSADTSQAPYGTNGMIYSFDQTGGNYKQFVIDSSLLTNNTIRTYSMPNASGTLALTSDLGSYVPYTGATANVNLGTFDLTADVITGATGSFASSGGSDTFAINHSSGSGIALNITKGGNGEGLVINKTSGSGNALSVTGSTSLGALSGTSATFSSTITATDAVLTKNGDITIKFNPNNVAKWDLYYNNADGTIGFYDRVGSAFRMTLAQTGAATFSGGLLTINVPTDNTTVGIFHAGGGTANRGLKISTFAATNDNAGVTLDAQTSTGVLAFATAGAEKMRITSGGQVGIGTTSIDSSLSVDIQNRSASSNNVLLRVKNTSASEDVGFVINGINSTEFEYKIGINTIANTSDLTFSTAQASGYRWYTSSAERMRITSGGKVVIGATSTTYGSLLGLQTATSAAPVAHFNNNRNVSGDSCMYMQLGPNARDTSSYYLQAFDITQDQLYIYGNGNVVNRNGSYGTISDSTLKENITDATPKLADLLQLKVRNFNLIDDESKTKQIGFIAQEFEEVFPAMIDIDGKSGKKTIKTSVLVPMLVKAIQELKAEIDELKNK